jgi:hypothetical protein
MKNPIFSDITPCSPFEEQGVEENVWTEESRSDGRLENTI